MLEALASSGLGSSQSYPDSGPGPKTLRYGTSDLGYFGEVTANELLTLNELRRQLNFWGGTDNAPSPTWIKMFSAGKVIYFPTQAAAVGIGWNMLYSAGLVYGTDDNGIVPGSPGVNQMAVVNKDAFNFKVRCFKSQVVDPANHGGLEAIGTSDILKAGEWGTIISAIISPRQSGYTGTNWALYPYNLYILPSTSQAISQNTRQADQTSCLGINNTQVGLIPKSSAGYIWLPVLELIPATDPVYFSIKDPTAVTQGRQLPLVVNDPSYEDSLIAYRSFDGGVQMGRAIATGDVEYLDPYYRIDVSTIKMANAPAVPLIVGDVTYE